jgi:hypothetical protein
VVWVRKTCQVSKTWQVWDEFEDIVADLYGRLWNDSHMRMEEEGGGMRRAGGICPPALKTRRAEVVHLGPPQKEEKKRNRP